MIMGSGVPNAPYSQGTQYANYPTVWYGGPAPLFATGPEVKNRSHFRIPTRGLGQSANCMSLSDIQSQIGGPSNCDPHDSACVMCNVQKANAAEDAMISSSCIPPGTPISFACNTSAAALNAFMSNNPIPQPVTVAGATVTEIPTGGVNVNPPAPPQQQVVNPSPRTQVTTTGTSATSTTSAVSQANGTTASSTGLLSTVQGYISDLTSGTDIIAGVPNWVLIAGGVVAVVMIAQAGGRK